MGLIVEYFRLIDLLALAALAALACAAFVRNRSVWLSVAGISMAIWGAIRVPGPVLMPRAGHSPGPRVWHRLAESSRPAGLRGDRYTLVAPLGADASHGYLTILNGSPNWSALRVL